MIREFTFTYRHTLSTHTLLKYYTHFSHREKREKKMGDLYLGLDLSTQSLKSVLIDDQLNLVHSDVVVLDELG